MSRRGQNEGSIRRRLDGRWEARLCLPNGQRRSLFGATRVAVAERLARELKAISDGLAIPNERTSVGQYFGTWLEDVKREVRPGTWRRYEQLIRAHALPDIGRVKLTKLTPDHLRQLFAAKIDAGLAPATVRHLRAVIRLALQRALIDGLVLRNVATLTKAPRTPHDQGEAPTVMRTLTRAQAHEFLRLAAGDRLEALFYLAVSTGMRRGELLALRWSDVDLDKRELRVRGTLQRTPFPKSEQDPRSVNEITAPKTAAARRTVHLTAETVAALRRHRERQEREQREALLWDNSLGLVFTTEVGTPIEAGNLLRRSFWPLLRKIGLADEVERIERRRRGKKIIAVSRKELHPRLRFHDLRHTAATLLLEGGVHPSIVAAQLGHSRTSTTLNIYSHVCPTLGRTAAQIMEEMLTPDLELPANPAGVKSGVN